MIFNSEEKCLNYCNNFVQFGKEEENSDLISGGHFRNISRYELGTSDKKYEEILGLHAKKQ